MKKITADAREKILKSAVHLLRQSGLKSLGQIQVAKNAEVSQGHLTYHFPKRADLLLAVAERAIQPIWDLVGSDKAATGPRFKTFLIKLVQGILQDSQRTRALLGLLVESDENSELLKNLAGTSIQERDLIATILDKPKEDPEVMFIQSALMGMAIQHYLQRKSKTPFPTEKVLDVLIQKTDIKGKKRG